MLRDLGWECKSPTGRVNGTQPVPGPWCWTPACWQKLLPGLALLHLAESQGSEGKVGPAPHSHAEPKGGSSTRLGQGRGPLQAELPGRLQARVNRHHHAPTLMSETWALQPPCPPGTALQPWSTPAQGHIRQMPGHRVGVPGHSSPAPQEGTGSSGSRGPFPPLKPAPGPASCALHHIGRDRHQPSRLSPAPGSGLGGQRSPHGGTQGRGSLPFEGASFANRPDPGEAPGQEAQVGKFSSPRHHC